MNQAGWFLPKEYYDSEETMMSYKKFILGILENMNSSYSANLLVREVENMIALEKKFATVSFLICLFVLLGFYINFFKKSQVYSEPSRKTKI